MFSKVRVLLAVSALAVPACVLSATPANAADASPQSCPPEAPVYSFTSIANSSRPTNLKSAYITGPGTLSYNRTTTATASASMSASVSAEAGTVFAKASATVGATVGASYSKSDSFTYTLQVASGQRRAMQLFQGSKSFIVTKKTFSQGTCQFGTAYSSATNAPRTAQYDEWKLVS